MRLCAFLILVTGCGEDFTRTELTLCGDLESDEVDTFRVFAMDNRFRNELTAVVAGDEEGLPIVTEIPRQEGPGFIGVEALREGVFVARFVRRVGDRASATTLELPLLTSCLDIDCDDGQSCVDGACENAPLPGDPPYCE